MQFLAHEEISLLYAFLDIILSLPFAFAFVDDGVPVCPMSQ
jgi:hypothetical protein